MRASKAERSYASSGTANLIGLAGVVACLLIGFATPAGADPTGQLPVPYGMGAPIQAAMHDWNGRVPGANDPSCTPSPEHPNPVVLFTSTFLTDAVNWTAIAPYLHDQGYCVYTFNYGRTVYNVPPGIPGLDPIPSSAVEAAGFIEKVRASTGAAKVDLVGHSQGGLVARYYINELGGALHVDKMILLSSPYSATGLPVDVAEVARKSIPRDLYNAILYNGKIPPVGLNFIDPWTFEKAQPLQPNIRYTQITDIADEVGIYGGMRPPPGAANAVTRYINDACSTDFSQHFGQPYSPTAVAMIGNALDPAHQVTPPCTVVPLYPIG